MKKVYLKEYVEDRKLRASLELMKWVALFRTRKHETIPFAAIFLRLADRTLHHSSNVWSHFISDLDVPMDILKQIPDGAFIQTQDLASKYEIEAYLGAAKALFEDNFLGGKKAKFQNLIGDSFASDPRVLKHLEGLFAATKKEFFGVANQIRNHSYHVNPELKDYGFLAHIKKTNKGLVVTIPNIYKDIKGSSVDLAEVFISTHQYIERLIFDVINVLLEFYFLHDGPPSNRTFQTVRSQYGTMMVNLGPKGFEFSNFHENKGIQSPDGT